MRTFIFLLSLSFLLLTKAYPQNIQRVTLDQAIAMGVKESKSLQLSQSQLEYAQSRQNEAYDLAYPVVNFSASYSRLSDVAPFIIQLPDQPAFSVPISFPNSAQASVSLHQLVFAGFRVKEAKEASTSNLLASQVDYSKSDQDARLNIITAYYNLYKVQQSVPTIQANLDQIAERLKDMQNMASQGMATQNDVLRIQLQQSNVQLVMIDAQNILKEANYNFGILLGLTGDVTIELDTTSLFQQQSLNNETGFIDSALKNRPEIRSLLLHEDAAQSNLRAARTAYLPNISVDGNYLVANPNPRIFPPEQKFDATWEVGLTLNWGITNLFTNKHVIDENKALLDEQKSILAQVTDNVKSEVYQDYLGYKESLEKLAVLHQAEQQALENMKEIDSRYKNSIATISDLTDAQTQQIQAQINLIIGRADAQINYQRLMKSTGTF